MGLSRRQMLAASAPFVGIAAFQNIPLCIAQPASKGPPDRMAPSDAPAKIIIASREEPGIPMLISGRVTNGDNPIKGASMFVYHTDAKGIYQRDPNDNPYEARLWGVLRTDSDGRYEYKTIRPASYPNTRFPAHVHHAMHAPDYRTVFPEFNFDDDPFMSDPGSAKARRD